MADICEEKTRVSFLIYLNSECGLEAMGCKSKSITNGDDLPGYLGTHHVKN